ncbi:O-antigen ligase family protein [Caulobacter sp. 17J65-9]|uniref:O-antigen ligase family protein n=1 Tax=Caulobacter sp. 17J65-9 TaxID=2709382 RepID=UPI0013CC10A0|nr:O-antigen ligase family protein [Caulobacter sp. 17J65-9]NEX94002.1 O-antigen ligase family protein [Caulobacter sp. 17J65-9]
MLAVRRPMQAHRPFALALALLCIVYFYTFLGTYSIDLGAPVTPGQVTYLLVGGGFVVGVLGFVQGDRYSFGLLVAAALYLVLLAFDRVFNPYDLTLTITRIAWMLSLVACVFVFGSVRRFQTLITALQLMVLFACTMNLLDYFAHDALPFPMSPIPGRGAGLYVNPNSSASYIALAVPLACGMARRKVSLALYAITFVGVLLTFSRSGMITWLAAVAMTELFIRNRRVLAPRTIALLLGAGFVVLVLFLAGRSLAGAVIDLLGPSLPPRLADRLLLDMNDFSAQERQYVAGAAWRLFLQHPFTGSGVGLPDRWIYGQMPHNTMLLTLAEFGVLGGIWLAVWVRALHRIAGPFGLTLAVLWLVVAMFSHNQFDQIGAAVLIAMYWTGAARSRGGYVHAQRRVRAISIDQPVSA